MTIKFSEFSNKIQNTTHRFVARKLCEQIVPTADRELFFSTDAYSAGKIVESEGKIWEIVDKRSNYVVICNESGELKKKFPTAIKPSQKRISYSKGTFKGTKIPPEFSLVVESVANKDPVAVLKCISAYKEKDYRTMYSIAESLGANMNSIEEATKSEQFNAASIVASAIGCKSLASTAEGVLADIKKKAASGGMTQNQKKIYHDMLGMLQKLGMNIDESVENSFAEDISGGESRQIRFNDLKKKLVTPEEKITAPGSTLGASNDTHRKLLVKKLRGD